MAIWHRYSWIAYLAVFIGVLGHASTEFFAVLSGVGGPELSVWRFALGSLGLIIVALIQPSSRDLIAPFRTHAISLIAISFIGISIGYLIYHWALDFASVPQVATIVTTIPIFVALINLAINHERITLGKIVSGFCAVAGVALLITDGYVDRLTGNEGGLLGVFLAILSTVAVSAYAVLVRPIVAIYGALRITAITMSLGTIGMWFLVGFSFNIWVSPNQLGNLTNSQLIPLLIIGLWNTTIAQFLWIGGLAAVPDMTRGSYLLFLKPVIAAILAVFILKQDLSTVQMIAIVIVTSSVLAEILAGKRRAAKT